MLKNKYECPVYLCTSKHPTEDALVDHYNKDHADLVALGLKLRKSKKARNEERLRKAKDKANRIVIDDTGLLRLTIPFACVSRCVCACVCACV